MTTENVKLGESCFRHSGSLASSLLLSQVVIHLNENKLYIHSMMCSELGKPQLSLVHIPNNPVNFKELCAQHIIKWFFVSHINGRIIIRFTPVG